jgi:hypothetical protein
MSDGGLRVAEPPVSLFKDERMVVKEFLQPRIKKQGFRVRHFVKYLSIKEKLKKEGSLSGHERLFTHYGQPDIDLFFWNGEGPSATLFAAEVKYFRGRPDKKVYPNSFYAGLDEALALLTFGFDAVFLWHFFDPNVEGSHKDLTTSLMQTLTGVGSLPVNYFSWSIPPGIRNAPDDPFKRIADLAWTIMGYYDGFPLPPNYRPNPLLHQQSVQTNRTLLRKAFRII